MSLSHNYYLILTCNNTNNTPRLKTVFFVWMSALSGSCVSFKFPQRQTTTSPCGQPDTDPLSLILFSPDKTPIKTSFLLDTNIALTARANLTVFTPAGHVQHGRDNKGLAIELQLCLHPGEWFVYVHFKVIKGEAVWKVNKSFSPFRWI